jgi:hypothetical protein
MNSTKWELNTQYRTNLGEISCENLKWFEVAQYRGYGNLYSYGVEFLGFIMT